MEIVTIITGIIATRDLMITNEKLHDSGTNTTGITQWLDSGRKIVCPESGSRGCKSGLYSIRTGGEGRIQYRENCYGNCRRHRVITTTM